MVSSMGTVETTEIFSYRVETHARLASLTLLVYEAGCVNSIICLHNAADSLDLL